MATKPIIHTPLPKDVPGHHGEYELGQKLSKLESDGLELWFDVNYLPGVPDIDLVLFSPKVGLFVAEVKAHRLDEIGVYDFASFVQSNGEKRQHPVNQVRNASQKLRGAMSQLTVKYGKRVPVPFVQNVVIWPRIKRSEWVARFSEQKFVLQSYSFLFEEDLVSEAALMRRLGDQVDNPLGGVTPPPAVRGDHDGVKELREFLKVQTKTGNLSPSKVAALTSPKPESKNVVDRYPFGEKYDVYFTGHPGTGKTSLLQEIGIRHAQAGASVLYVCFNKVLATEVKRNFQVLRADKPLPGHIDVFDEYDLYAMILGEPEVDGILKDAQSVITKLLEYPESRRPKFDTILIDESQDLPGGVFQLLKQLSHEATSTFIAYGKGQELYGYDQDRPMPAEEFAEWMNSATRVTRARQFRGAPMPFLVAQAFYEHAPNVEAGLNFIREKAKNDIPSPGDMQLALDIPSPANSLTLEYLAVDDNLAASVRGAILESVQEVKDAGSDADLLIVVLSKNPANEIYPMVLENLNQLNLQVHNLTQDDIKRIEAPVGSVRLSTSMGVRGITASHVLVFDFAKHESFCEKPGRPPFKNLGYVVLSRAQKSTRIMVPTDEVNDYVRFLQACIDEVRKLEILNLRKK
jgi:hypothetical protein